MLDKVNLAYFSTYLHSKGLGSWLFRHLLKKWRRLLFINYIRIYIELEAPRRN